MQELIWTQTQHGASADMRSNWLFLLVYSASVSANADSDFFLWKSNRISFVLIPFSPSPFACLPVSFQPSGSSPG